MGTKKNRKDAEPQDATTHPSGFAYQSEIDKLKENIFRSDKDKFYLLIKMLRRNQVLKRAVITRKAE
jgi:hypothetical protein